MTNPLVDLSLLSAEQKQLLLQQLLAEQSPRENAYPLSIAQQGLWFLHQLSPDDPAYNLKFAIWLSGPCDLRKIRQTMEELLRRHDTLRTVFSTTESGTTQKALEEFKADFRVVDASTMSDEELEQQLNIFADRPFDLERGLPVRIALFRLADERHLLALSAHHAVIDLWSFRVLAEDIIALYRAQIDDRDAALPPVDGTYSDYVQWQRELLAGPEGDRLRAYWERKLAGDLTPLQLPCDRPRRPVPSRQGNSYEFEVPAEVAKQLRKLSKSSGLSIFTIFTAAYQVLLHRYCGQDDIVVGTPMLGRSRPEFQETVGFFVNTVPIRCDLSGNPTFRDFLNQVHRTITEAIEHQEYPLPLMVRSMAQRRGMNRTPLIQTLIAWDRVFHVELMRRAVDDGSEPDRRIPLIDKVAVEQRGAGFDLVLFVVRDTGGVIHPRFQYNADLFDAATIERMAEHFCILLESAATETDRPIDELELSSAVERDRLIVDFNRRATKTVADEYVHRLFEAQARRNPEHTALEYGPIRVTYGELNARADRLARLLRGRGVTSNVLVGLYVGDPVHAITAMLAVLKAGGAYVPLDPEQGAERLQMILDDAQCPVIVVDAARRAALPPTAAAIVDLDADVGSSDDEGSAPLEQAVSGDDLAYVIYTSGSTGRPNGVLISHGNVAHSIAARISCFPRAPVRMLLVLPFYFDSSISAIYGTLGRGGSLVIPASDWRQRLDQLPTFIAERGVTDLICIPSLWNGILQTAEAGQLQSMRSVIVAGESCRRDLAERHGAVTPQAELFNEYGPTEASVWCTVYRVDRNFVGETVPIGRPISDAQVYVLDERLKPVPQGVIGELFVGGRGVACGYLNRPELTTARFLPDPFADDSNARLYRTGDLARLRGDGELEFIGRADHQVKVSGYRVELEEVEAALTQLPDVAQAAVAAHPRANGDMRLTAYVVFRGAPVDALDLRTQLSERLPKHMIPSAFVAMPSLPLNANGKVNRRALPEPARMQADADRPYVAPRTPLESELAEIWAEVLELPRVGIDDDFFALGGASIQVLQVAAHAKRRGIFLTAEQMFRHPTIAALAGECEKSDLVGGNTLIESLGVYLPPNAVTTADVLRGCKRKIDLDLEKLTGIRSRRMAGDTEFSIDLAARAVEECLARSRFTPDDVDLLICCNISRCDGPDYRFSFEPSTAARLAAQFGCRNAAAFDVGNACAGMFTGIYLADALLKRGIVDCALVVSGEYITHLTRKAQQEIASDFDPRVPCLTLGDAGAAVALMRTPDARVGFHDIDLYTLGRYHDLCVAKLSDRLPAGPIMITDLLSMSEVTTKEVMKLWPSVAVRHGWGIPDVRHIIPHQVSNTTLNNGLFAVKDLSIADEINVVTNVAERANTATTTHSVAVWDHARSGAIRAGENVLFGITGSGMTVGAALYTFDDLPERLRIPAKKPSLRHRRPAEALRRHRAAQMPRLQIDSVGVCELPPGVAKGAFDAGGQAAEECLAASTCKRTDLGMLVYTGVYRDEYLSEPAAAAIIAGRIDLNGGTVDEERKGIAFDLLNGGVGTLQACYLAQYAGRTTGRRATLIVAAEVENNGEFPDPLRRGIVPIGSALLLRPSDDGRTGFGGFASVSLHDRIDALQAWTRYDERRGFLDVRASADLEEVYAAAACSAVEKLLQDTGIKLSDIRHIFPPQVSKSFLRLLAERLQVSPDVMVDVVREGGDLFTSSLPCAWRQAAQTNRFRPGDLGVIVAVGAGIQATAALYHF